MQQDPKPTSAVILLESQSKIILSKANTASRMVLVWLEKKSSGQ